MSARIAVLEQRHELYWVVTGHETLFQCMLSIFMQNSGL
jgi:hypothetical protein